jgi:hypothetical protein
VVSEISKKKLDWRAILQDIRAQGTSIYLAAKILGKPESTLQSWLTGKHEPSYSHGTALLTLHAAVCGEDATKKRCTEESVYAEVK